VPYEEQVSECHHIAGLVRVTYQFERNEEQVVNNKGPFATVSISSNTKGDGSNRSEHEHKRDAPGNVRLGLSKVLSQVGDGQRNGEEIKGIPSLHT
jgi:hypothetical protein